MFNDKETIAELKSLNKPILIYGNSTHSQSIKNILAREGLQTVAFVVDENYYVEDKFIDGIKVESIADYADKFENYSLVNGFNNVLKSQVVMTNNPLLMKTKIYMIWNVGFSWTINNEYLKINEEIINEMNLELGDELSKQTFKAILKAKSTGEYEDALKVAVGNQYFNELTYEREPNGEVFVDCGAYDGDTILKFNQFVNGKCEKFYAFEPSEENCSMLKRNTSMLENAVIVRGGVWNKRDTLYFNVNSTASTISESATENKIEVYPIDEVVGNDKVTFIKMDIEGSELKALEGAKETIKHNLPKLAICTYHRRDDLIDIYRFMKQFESYKVYLRQHAYAAVETVMYGIPINK